MCRGHRWKITRYCCRNTTDLRLRTVNRGKADGITWRDPRIGPTAWAALLPRKLFNGEILINSK